MPGSWSSRRGVVTGANGFLGSEIVKQLHASGFWVRASDLQPEQRLPGASEYRSADIRSADQIKSLMEGVDFVVHAAGLVHRFKSCVDEADLFQSINVLGTENVARSAAEAGAKAFMLISSVSVYGPCSDFANETSLLAPEGIYAISKHRAEEAALAVAATTGMRLVILRLTTLYGEEDPGNVRRLIQAIAQRRFLRIGPGTNRRSLLYRSDAALAIRRVVEMDFAECGVFNVAGEVHTMKEIVDEIASALKTRVFPLAIPQRLLNLTARGLLNSGHQRLADTGRLIRKWLANNTYDCNRFEVAYKYKAEVSLSEGLRREISWMLDNATSR